MDCRRLPMKENSTASGMVPRTVATVKLRIRISVRPARKLPTGCSTDSCNQGMNNNASLFIYLL